MPKGLIKIAERKFPCESCITARVVPQDGQGTVVTFLNKQTVNSWLWISCSCCNEKSNQPYPIKQANKIKRYIDDKTSGIDGGSGTDYIITQCDELA